jgi:hypothetical protein
VVVLYNRATRVAEKVHAIARKNVL